jgi:hypothetical protein
MKLCSEGPIYLKAGTPLLARPEGKATLRARLEPVPLCSMHSSRPQLSAGTILAFDGFHVPTVPSDGWRGSSCRMEQEDHKEEGLLS